MGWFDSTNAILGIAGEQRAQREETASRKRENWQKLMDLANAGVDIWSILSGRKYQTQERIMTEAYQSDEAAKERQHAKEMAEAGHGYAREEFDWRAKFDADQAALDRTWEEGQNQLNRDLQERLASLERAAQTQDRQEARQQFLSEWVQRAYELALSNQSFLDVNGQFDPQKREALRAFLYTQVDDMPTGYLSKEESEWAKKSFDGFVNALGVGITTPPLASETGGNIPLKDQITIAKEQLAKVRSLVLPDEVDKQVDDIEMELKVADAPPSAGHKYRDIQPLISKLTTIYNIYAKKSQATGSEISNIRALR